MLEGGNEGSGTGVWRFGFLDFVLIRGAPVFVLKTQLSWPAAGAEFSKKQG
jgi:hypothetical protein